MGLEVNVSIYSYVKMFALSYKPGFQAEMSLKLVENNALQCYMKVRFFILPQNTSALQQRIGGLTTGSNGTGS